jgi:hypothetical protein
MKTIFTAIVIAVSAAITPLMPNQALTPGATNSAVTQANIHQTICISGFTATIRPPVSYTNALKKKQLESGYAYKGDMNLADYEEDHLISLELGGNPTDPKNLWPEPYVGATGARVKDQVENKLHDMVCAGQLTLVTAQTAIATNWWAAYNQYVLGKPLPVETPSPTPTQTQTPAVVNAPKVTPEPSKATSTPITTRKPTAAIQAPAIVAPKATPTTPALPTISAGAYCATSDAGKQGKSSTGTVYTCKTSATDSHLRWRL